MLFLFKQKEIAKILLFRYVPFFQISDTKLNAVSYKWFILKSDWTPAKLFYQKAFYLFCNRMLYEFDILPMSLNLKHRNRCNHNTKTHSSCPNSSKCSSSKWLINVCSLIRGGYIDCWKLTCSWEQHIIWWFQNSRICTKMVDIDWFTNFVTNLNTQRLQSCQCHIFQMIIFQIVFSLIIYIKQCTDMSDWFSDHTGIYNLNRTAIVIILEYGKVVAAKGLAQVNKGRKRVLYI